jgi:DNA-binding transcriptional regulator YiaG
MTSPPVAADVGPEARYSEVPEGVVRGPRVMDSAHEMAHEAAIANAEAALAQVASRVREPRVKPLEPGSDAEFNGELLRQVRESKGMSIHTLAERTRIAQRHIENVEADRYDALPAAVYLRGILMSMARELALDPLRVAKSYLALATRKGKS